MLSNQIRTSATYLGIAGFGDPRQPRTTRPRRDARLTAGDIRRRRALPLPRRPRSLRRDRRALHRFIRARHLRPGVVAGPAARRRRGRDDLGPDRHPCRGARRDRRGRAQRHLSCAAGVRRSIGLMAIDVTVLRVFTDAEGKFGNPLGVVDARTVAPAERQRIATALGYSETIFVDLPTAGAKTAQARIFTP